MVGIDMGEEGHMKKQKSHKEKRKRVQSVLAVVF
jgi:hypothetical protein